MSESHIPVTIKKLQLQQIQWELLHVLLKMNAQIFFYTFAVEYFRVTCKNASFLITKSRSNGWPQSLGFKLQIDVLNRHSRAWYHCWQGLDNKAVIYPIMHAMYLTKNSISFTVATVTCYYEQFTWDVPATTAI